LGLGAGSARLSQAQWRVDGAPVCTAAYGQDYPTIVSDGAGGAIITWEDYRSGTNLDIYAQRVDAVGVPQWAADGVALCTDAGDQSYPRIVSDGAGGAIVAWQDHRNGTNWGVYAQRVDAAGALQWTADGVALCTDAGNQQYFYPTLVSDGAGGAIVTWDDYRGGTYPDIYAQRVDAAGAPQWTANGVPLCTAPYDQGLPTIASDGLGGAIVAWYDGRSSVTSWDTYAQRVNAAGVVQWAADGVPLCTAPNRQGYPTIVSDGAGGAIVAWPDNRSGPTNSNIFAQRVSAAGAPQWTANGVPLCTAAFNQSHSTITLDGLGGAVVTWMDGRGGTYADIYAQHVLASGAVDPAWTPNGVALCTAADDQFYPQIVTDGVGGAIVTWYDYRVLDSHIYAQHVLAYGVVDPAWTVNGVPLSTAGSYQDFPMIASDDAGGAIVAWGDYRSGTNYDIYAQRVYGAGAVAAVPRGDAPAHFQLFAPSPNPTRDGRLSIRFSLPTSGRVTAQVLDLAGHRVRALATEREFSPGLHVLGWDGRNDAGVSLPSGVYFVEVRVGRHPEARQAILLH